MVGQDLIGVFKSYISSNFIIRNYLGLTVSVIDVQRGLLEIFKLV
ncbi:hypothetical protein N482_02580 [Pseudoalteromonas luteoviolacea NCIMB 1942]|uniref:Uncharacterized protein n=1 Tax=Pseudoalteromonas luteoviolacea NCIMB 1942 TaxID=1365253 RepID=A0A167A1V4_9GAMM|nr:hypothetical protein N482_02580 [Pseudoalteromonas luteoviolacea NCIMB 1942]